MYLAGDVRPRSPADARCPLRPGEPCTLCHPEAKFGPQDCPTVALVRDDPELWAALSQLARRGTGQPN